MTKQTRLKRDIFMPDDRILSPLKRHLHAIHPWGFQHQPDYSEIEAYVEITGKWEIIADVKGINHVAIAEFIVALANEHNRKPRKSGQDIDNALLKYALDEDEDQPNPAGKGMGIELIAHYAAQLVHQVAIGPLTPKLIVLGGQMATAPVVRAVGKNVLAFAKGYPRRDWLINEAAMEKYVVASVPQEEENSRRDKKNSGKAVKPQFTIELEGAVTIALSKATEPADQGSVLLFDPHRKR